MIRLRIILIWLCLGLSGLSAETLLLNDGSVVRGEITLEDRTTVVIETEQGPRSFQKRDIQKIFYGDSPDGLAAKDADDDAKQASSLNWSAFTRSLALPGSHRWENGDVLTGVLMGAAVVFAGYDAYLDHRRLLSTENDHRLVAGTLAVSPRNQTEALAWGYQFNFENQLYSRLGQRAQQRAESLSILGLLYALQALDALLLGSNWDLLSTAHDPTVKSSGLRLQITGRVGNAGGTGSRGTAAQDAQANRYTGFSLQYRF